VNNWVADGPDTAVNTVGGTEKAIADGALWSYTDETVGVYKCKTDASDRLRSYSLSRAMNGRLSDSVGDFRVATSTIQIKGASGKMVFVDSESLTKWIDGSFCPMQEPGAVPPVWYRRPSRNISARHNGGVNMSFADYHCEWVRYKDSRTPKFTNWEITSEQASPDNEDLREYTSKMTLH
jgi:prepilin-type processing-associated H-X9-DG protein